MIQVQLQECRIEVGEGETHRTIRITPLIQGMPLGFIIDVPIERLASTVIGKALQGEVVLPDNVEKMAIPKEKAKH